MPIEFIPVTQQQLKLFEYLGGRVTIQISSSTHTLFAIGPVTVESYRRDKALVGVIADQFISRSSEDERLISTFHSTKNKILSVERLETNCWIMICH